MIALHVVVDSRFRLLEASPRLLERLQQALTFAHPEHTRRVRLGLWTGSVPRAISLVKRDTRGRWTLPRGAAALLRSTASACGYALAWEDRRTIHARRSWTVSVPLRDYQQEASHALGTCVQGCAVLPCGAGKSVIGIAALAHVAQPALVLVHTRDLLEQWQQVLRHSLGIEPGCARKPTEIVVTTVQTLVRMEPARLAALGSQFGCVLIDEAHHVPATTFQTVLDFFPAKYRFALTATPERSDGLTPILEKTVGPIVYRLEHGVLFEHGYLVAPRIVPVETGRVPWAPSYEALLRAIVKDEERNERICRSVINKDWRSVLIVSARVAHVHALADRLRARGVDAEALSGSLTPAQRRALLQRFRTGDLRVVCATSLADEGLDIDYLECLLLATPARAEGRTIQRLGRLMRPHPKKRQPVLYDLVDDAPLARRQFAARMRAYRRVLGSEALRGPLSSDERAHPWNLLRSAS